jgi:hypothetical protein
MRLFTWPAMLGLLALGAGPAFAIPAVSDHLKCFKIRDAQFKASYTADLGGITNDQGCLIKVPGQLLCVAATKTNITPAPPGGTGPAAHRYVCYKAKCPKNAGPGTIQWLDQFGNRPVVAAAQPNLLCAPEAGTAPSCTGTGTACGSCAGGGVCVPDVAGGGVCAATTGGLGGVCTQDSDCGAGHACVGIPGSGNHCVTDCP